MLFALWILDLGLKADDSQKTHVLDVHTIQCTVDGHSDPPCVLLVRFLFFEGF